MDHGHRELPTAESIGYGAVSILERPRDLRTVPVLGVSDIAETKVVLFGPKKWDVVEGFTLAEDIMRRCLALALGDDPMFDADPLTGKSVRPACDVASREDASDAGLEIFIDDNAAINLEPRLFRQRDRRPHADPDDDEVGLKAFSAFQRHALVVYRRRCRAEVERHAVALMEIAQEIPDLWSQYFLHQDRLGPDYMDFDIPGTKRCRALETNEAGADHNRTLRHQSAGDQRAAVSQSPQVMHVWESRPGDAETDWLGSGRKQQRVIGMTAAIGEMNLSGRRVDCRHACAQVQSDFVVFIEFERSERVRLVGCGA